MSEHLKARSELQPYQSIPEFLDIYRENPRGLPETWGSVPMIMTPPIQEQQRSVDRDNAKLFAPKNKPDYVCPELGDYMEHVNLARAAHRLMRNRDSYSFRGNYEYQIPLELTEVASAALDGSSSPAELLYMRAVWHMPSVELGSLTHPYGQRMKPHLEKMRAAVNQAVEMHGGVLFKDVKIHGDEHEQQAFQDSLTEYEVKGADSLAYGLKNVHGIHMTRKIKVGVLPDGTEVVERSSFVIRCEALPERMQKAVRSIRIERDSPWAQDVMQIPGFMKHVAQLLADDTFDVAMPLSTTVVAMHEGDEQAYEALSQELKRDRMLRSATSSSYI